MRKLVVLVVALRVLTIPGGGVLAQNPMGEPLFGTFNLSTGFTPDPQAIPVLAGGDTDASALGIVDPTGGPCRGFISASQPDVRVNFTAGTTFPLRFYVESAVDTTLLVNLPDSTWRCNDDAFHLNPAVDIPVGRVQSGQYDVWVGTYGQNAAQPATLFVTELLLPWPPPPTERPTARRTATATATPTEAPGDAVCGAANNQSFTCFAATDLCATGTASAVTGEGPWSWSCIGLSGGAAVNCSAKLQPPCVPQPSGLVSWWPASGDAADVIGDKNGTLVNDAAFADGKAGQGFGFNGVNQYVALPEMAIQGNRAWTVVAWFRTASGGAIIGTQNAPYGTTLNTVLSSWDPLLFVGTDGKLRGGIWPAQLASSQAIADGAWHHAAISYESGVLRLYLDGAPIASASGLAPPDTPVNQIGTGYTVYWDAGHDGWFDFDGQIDEVVLFSRPLSAGEILKIYNAGASGLCRSTPRVFDSLLNGSGSVVTHWPSSSGANAVALQPDGKIVVAGYQGGNLVVARYLACGSLDPGFGNGTGSFVFSNPGGEPIEESTAYGVAVYNGKIVVVGRSARGDDWEVVVVRLNDAGDLDTAFAGTGYVRWNAGRGSAASAVAIQGGKILVTGHTHVDRSNSALLLLRYNWDGSLDTSFGSARTGVVTVATMTYDGSMGGQAVTVEDLEGKAVAVQSWDSKVVVLAQSGFPHHTAVYRFTATGNLDTSFGAGGKTMPYSGDITGMRADAHGGLGSGLAIQRDRKILMAGLGNRDPENIRTVVLRYTEAGYIDTTYGTGGEGSYTETRSGSVIGGLAIQNDGKSVVVGTMADQVHPGNPNPQSDLLMVRFTAQGTIDTSFGSDGVVVFNGPLNGTDEGRAVVIQPDAKIVVAGETSRTGDSHSRDLLVLRVKGTRDGILHEDLSPIGDRIMVDDVRPFPDWGTIQIDDEVIRYKGKKSGGAGAALGAGSQPGYLLIVRRGINGTAPAAHSAGALVVLVASPACGGDCNTDGEVTIDELLMAVNIALGNLSVPQCNAGDTNGNGQIAIDELVAAVNNALHGCFVQ